MNQVEFKMNMAKARKRLGAKRAIVDALRPLSRDERCSVLLDCLIEFFPEDEVAAVEPEAEKAPATELVEP